MEGRGAAGRWRGPPLTLSESQFALLPWRVVCSSLALWPWTQGHWQYLDKEGPLMGQALCSGSSQVPGSVPLPSEPPVPSWNRQLSLPPPPQGWLENEECVSGGS